MRALSRAGRRTNVAALAVLGLAMGSGVLAFATGSEAAVRVVVAVHGIAGLCLVLLTPWKAVIVRRGLAKAGRGLGGRGASVALGALVLLVVGTGIAHAVGATGPYLGVTMMQVHVGTAIVVGGLVLVHAWGRHQRPRRSDLGRRGLLRAGALAGGGVLLWSATEVAAGAVSLPGAGRRATGSHERGTDDPGRMPVTQWLSDSVPAVDAARFRLEVVAGRTVALGVRDLDGSDSVRAVLDCTGGWYAEQDWRGMRLDHLLAETVGVPAHGRSVDVVSLTGYRRRLPLTDTSRLLLATSVAGRPLSRGHGAPVRLVAPGRRGFWWVKWVARIEVVDAPWWLQPPFPGQ